ncbi:hypothetical protein ZWY2020_059750 [Hordeum vulgare]|nr:hypothetical protein ZWY2020_059750 [Hordeum vulgare]
MCDPEADPGDLAAATPSPPAARKETTEVKGGVIRGGIVGSPCRSRDLSDAEEVPSHRRWAAVFEDSTSAGRLQRVGSIHLHLASRWVTVRDEDNDILAGRFLQDGEDPKVGDGMDIDGFLLIVGDLREEVPIHRDIAKQNQPHPGNDTGPNNTIVHRDLRFGAFDPASAPAKFGSRAESPRLPRFAGKTSRIFKGSVQSNSALKPLSLEEYLLGAKATSTKLPIVPGAPVTSASAGLMEVCTADGLGHPTGQP